MFEQHPVPQQISSYQFRLVGDMTLKQFFQLAGGAVIGLLIYASPLPSIFKWPLIIFAVVSGAAFAFLPLQERPLSEWLSAFFRSIYGPTIYTWQKTETKDIYFLPANGLPTTSLQNGGKPLDASSAKLDAFENKFLGSIGGLFGLSPKPQTVSTQAPTVTPSIPQETPQTVPSVTPIKMAEPIQSARIVSQTIELPKIETPVQTQQPGNLFVATPQIPKVSVPAKGFTPITENNVAQIKTVAVNPVMNGGAVVPNVAQAQTSPDAAPPTPPTIPNILVGQILSADNKIIDSAIMEIKDFQGRPVRALKTNRLGHFMIVTPLPSGSYTLTTEKEGMLFDPVSVELHGAIVPPILIKSKQ